MEKVFLIYKNHASYEGRAELMGFATEEFEARQIVAKLSGDYNKAKELANKIDEASNRFKETEPLPHIENLLFVPKWKAGISKEEITIEMRKEREHLTAKNEMIINKNSLKTNEYLKKRFEFILPIFESFEEKIKTLFTVNKDNWITITDYLEENSPFYYEKVEKFTYEANQSST